MRPLLLDTIVLLWWLAGDGRLDMALAHRIRLGKQRVYVSVASAWEICALEREGQVSFERPARDCLPAALSAHRLEWLPLDYRHVFLAQQLSRDTLDPYDRLILAQASVEGLALVTTNDRLRAPGVEIVEGRTRQPEPMRPIPITSTPFPRPASTAWAGTAGTPEGSAPADDPEDRPIPEWNAFPWGG
jgi:PIN domain nuclease of toxin-antitoxin system